MHAGTDDMLEEQSRGLAEMAKDFHKKRVEAARKAARESAVRIKSLNVRVRTLARSGVRLTNISHETVQKLIELQADVVDSALTEAAARIERLAYTQSVRDLARDQADVLRAARERIVDDLSRALAILKDSGGAVREAAAEASGKARPAAKKTTARRPAKRKVARPVKAGQARRQGVASRKMKGKVKRATRVARRSRR